MIRKIIFEKLFFKLPDNFAEAECSQLLGCECCSEERGSIEAHDFEEVAAHLRHLQKPDSTDRTEKNKIVARDGKAAAVVEWLLGTEE